MKSIFKKIRTAADEMDCDKLKEIFRSMEAYSIPQNYKALFIKVKEYVLRNIFLKSLHRGVLQLM